jgi:indole-3-glycerol phosphate synthase
MTEENVLTRIIADKRVHVDALIKKKSFTKIEGEAMMAPAVRDFAGALKSARMHKRVGLIAEVKKASPSAGDIRDDFDAIDIAMAYAEAGASCLSVLTDEPYFKGENAHLKQARAATHLPVLRKDFMIDPYQIAESRAIGADCILLIMACLEDNQAQDMAQLAGKYGMCILLEVHNEAEMHRALSLKTYGANVIGINNRNLKTLEIDLGTSERLAKLVPPERLLVSESGIKTREDVERLQNSGISTFLMGENLLKQPDIRAATKAIIG